MTKKSMTWRAISALLLTGMLAMGGLTGCGISGAAETESQDKEHSVSSEREAEQLEGKWQEGEISYQGKHYQYDYSLHVYLVMGIDKDGAVEPAEDYQSGGQSDAMFLLVANPDTEELSVVAINRNTMTDVRTFDKDGNDTGIATAQICIQHGFGDGEKLSCSYSVDAVENLMYNLPIDGYFAMNMGGIGIMNDAIGGVTLEVMDDIDSGDIHLTKGETVTLNGEEAYAYLRGRDCDVFASADERLERQKQYITAYFEQMKNMSDRSGALTTLYDDIQDYLVTDVDFTQVLNELLNYSYDDSRLYSVPGETKQGQVYEEYYADEDALYEQILEVFYTQLD